MPKIVDKEERKQMILQKALEVFSRVGYRDANFSLIAEACEISRPTVYQYFKDKNEIYYFAVKNVTDDMFNRYSAIAFDEKKGDELERIKLILRDLFDYAEDNSAAMANLVEFILSGKKDGVDVYGAIRSRTAKLRILLKRVLLSGVHSGVVRDCDTDRLGEELFNLVQAVGFQVGFFDNYSAEEGFNTVSDFINSYRAI